MLKKGERIDIYQDRRKQGWAMIGSALSVVAFYFMATDRGLKDALLYQIFGVFGMAFFGLGAIAMAVRLIRGRPALILDEEGVQFGKKRLKWTEVKRAYFAESKTWNRTTRYVAIAPKDSTPYLSFRSELNRMIVNDGEDVRFLFYATEIPDAELLELLWKYLDRYGSPEPGLIPPPRPGESASR